MSQLSRPSECQFAPPPPRAVGCRLLFAIACLAAIAGATYPLKASAAEKSFVAPDIVPEEAAPPAPSPVAPPPVPEPVSPAPAAIEIQPRTPAVSQVAPVVETPAISIETNAIETVTRTNPPRPAARPERPRDRVDVFVERHSSGCRAAAAELARGIDPCAPAAATPRYPWNAGDRAAGFRLRVQPLPRPMPLARLPKATAGGLTFPLAIPAAISSRFGYRIHPITGEPRLHRGTDFAAAEGTPVLAAYGGRVEVAGWLGGLGLAVVLSHGDAMETRYGHLSEILVQPGQQIEPGTPIGLVGSTGFSTGPHLHFEVWQRLGDRWVAVDPTAQILVALDRLEQYVAQLAGSSNARA